MFLMSNKRIAWISPVGDDARLGGGVAKAVGLLKQQGILNSFSHDYFSLLGMSKYQQLCLLFKLIVIKRYRTFLVHSMLAPLSIFLMLVPWPIKLIVLPHGELKQGALSIAANKKQKVFTVLKSFKFLNAAIKSVYVIASNQEEIDMAKRLLPVNNAFVLPDIVSVDLFFSAAKQRVAKDEGVNVVIVARMVANKGISHWLQLIKSGCWTDQNNVLNAIHVFFVAEDLIELARCKALADDISKELGINVFFYENMPADEMLASMQTLNNRLPILPSQFESFSYTLLECLGFEFKPLVWFNNELVKRLLAHKLCVLESDESFKKTQCYVTIMIYKWLRGLLPSWPMKPSRLI